MLQFVSVRYSTVCDGILHFVRLPKAWCIILSSNIVVAKGITSKWQKIGQHNTNHTSDINKRMNNIENVSRIAILKQSNSKVQYNSTNHRTQITRKKNQSALPQRSYLWKSSRTCQPSTVLSVYQQMLSTLTLGKAWGPHPIWLPRGPPEWAYNDCPTTPLLSSPKIHSGGCQTSQKPRHKLWETNNW